MYVPYAIYIYKFPTREHITLISRLCQDGNIRGLCGQRWPGLAGIKAGWDWEGTEHPLGRCKPRDLWLALAETGGLYLAWVSGDYPHKPLWR